MQGLRIFSATGSAPSAEEIDAAHRVAATHKEMRFGVINVSDPVAGVIVEYSAFKGTAITTPGYVPDWFYGYLAPRCWCRTLTVSMVGRKGAIPDFRPWWYSFPSINLALGDDDHLVRQVEGPRTYDVSYSPENGYNISYIDTVPETVNDEIPNPFGTVWWTHEMEASWAYANGYEYALSGPYIFPGSPAIAKMLDDAKALEEYINSGAEKSVASLSDGTVLASVTASTGYNFWYGNDIELRNHWNILRTTAWSGGSSVALWNYNYLSGEFTQADPLTFDVPSDVCAPSGDWNHASWFVAPSIAQAPASWQENWTADRTIARDRERARLKTCSDGIITYLRDVGFMPPEIEQLIKTKRPASSRAKRSISMTVLENSKISNDPTYSGTVRLSYTTTEDGVSTVHEGTFTGTATYEITYHDYYDANGAPQTTTTRRWIFDNFPCLLSWPPGAGGLDGAHSVLDDMLQAGGFILDQRIPLWMDLTQLPMFYLLSGAYQEGMKPDSRFGATTYDPYKAAATPPVPFESSEVIFTQPQFLLEYHNVSKPIYSSQFDNRFDGWYAFSLVDGEVISVIPVMYKSTALDFGLFPHANDANLVTTRYVIGRARFRYRYADGSFTFVDWKAIEDENGNPTAAEFPSASAYANINLVFHSDRTGWTDVKEDAKDLAFVMDEPADANSVTKLLQFVRNAFFGDPIP